MIKNFFRNTKIVFHDLDLYIRDDRHISKRIKTGLLIFISILSILYVANYLYLRSYENSYSNITELVNNKEYRVAYEKLIDILEEEPNDPFFLILAARANVGLAEETGNIRMKNLFLAKSLAFLLRAEKINPNLVEIYKVRGLAYLYLGQLSLAELAYKKMLTLDNQSSTGWSDLGNIYLTQGNITGAGDAFFKALELEPGNNQAVIGDIKILFLQKRFDRAIDLARSLYVRTEDRGVKVQLAEILGNSSSKLTKYDEAKNYFNEGLALDPNSVSINYGLAELSFYSSFSIKEPVESTIDSKMRAINVINLDPSYPYSYALLTRIASVTNNKADYDKYLQLTKEKVKDYVFMNQSQKDVFIKTLPQFDKSNNSIKIRVKSVKSTPSSINNNINTLISK